MLLLLLLSKWSEPWLCLTTDQHGTSKGVAPLTSTTNHWRAAGRHRLRAWLWADEVEHLIDDLEWLLNADVTVGSSCHRLRLRDVDTQTDHAAATLNHSQARFPS